MQSSSLPPRLSTRLLLSLYGEQRCDNVNQLMVQRKKMLTEIDNADVTKSLTLDMFLYPSMHVDLSQKIKRTYMSFLKEVSAVEAGNNHPNAAKTMYTMIARNNASGGDCAAKQLAAQREATSYFGHISDAQFDALWKLGEELQQHAVKTEKETMNDVAFGHDIVFSAPSMDAPPAWGNYFSLFDGADVFEKAREAVGEGKNSSVASAAVAAKAKPAEDPHASTRAWLKQLCDAHLGAFPNSVFDAAQLMDGLVKSCEQAGADEGTQQMLLFDLIGEEGFELMLEVIQNKDRILAMGEAKAAVDGAPQVLQVSNSSSAAGAVSGAVEGVSAEDLAAIRAAEQEDAYQQEWPDMDVPDEHLSANQRRKREQKRAKEMERMRQETTAEQGNYSFLQGHATDTATTGKLGLVVLNTVWLFVIVIVINS